METNTNRDDITTDEINALNTFAMDNGRIAFAHLCAGALEGDKWCKAQLIIAMNDIAYMSTVAFMNSDDVSMTEEAVAKIMLEVIDNAETVRPDGSVARGCFKV